ncbi:MAG: hypothetical protein IPM47_21335 [Sphingobacteriales bacterium]|nr:MAG: hypothetical protein IPM47_21335 [Sphingobacteriales bacterium]
MITRKKNFVVSSFLFVLTLFALTFIACEKEEVINNNNENITIATDESNAEDLFADVVDLTDLYAESFGGSGKTTDECPVITSTAPEGTYPNTITIDFGTSCESDGGRIRSGQIIITISDAMSNPGATKTKTFQDYTVNGILVQGTHTTTNNGLNDEGQPSHTHTLVGGSLTYPDGAIATREATQTVTMIEGWDTPDTRWDNVWAITGNSSGTSKTGVAYSTLITEQLIKRHNCRWIVSGVKELTRNGETATLDYGDGECNRFAILTTADGETHEIRLPR